MAAPVFLVVVIAFFGSAPRLTCFRGGSSGSSDAATAVITSDGEVVASIVESLTPTSPIVESPATSSVPEPGGKPSLPTDKYAFLNSCPFEKYIEDRPPVNSELKFWPGISIVCNFRDASEWEQMVQDLEKIPLFREYFLPLPVASYHVTVSGFFDMFVRGKKYPEKGGSLHSLEYMELLNNEGIWRPVSEQVEEARISPRLGYKEVIFGWASLLVSLQSTDPDKTPGFPAGLKLSGESFLDVVTRPVRAKFEHLGRKMPTTPDIWHFTIGYCPTCTNLKLEDRVKQDIESGSGLASYMYEVLASMNRSNDPTPDMLAGNKNATTQIGQEQVTEAEEEVHQELRAAIDTFIKVQQGQAGEASIIDTFIEAQKEQISEAIVKFMEDRRKIELNLEPAELCRFWDMSAFKPWDGREDGTYGGNAYDFGRL